MNKDHRLHVRLAASQYRRIEGLTRSRGISVAEYIRSLIEMDLSPDRERLRRTLARHVVYTTVIAEKLLELTGDEEDIKDAREKFRSTAREMRLCINRGMI